MVLSGVIDKLDKSPLAPLADMGGSVPSPFTPSPVSLPITPAPLVPTKILLGALLDGRLGVHSPITVKFTSEEPNIIAEAVDFNEFGFGQNHSEALADLQHAIAELYFTLEESNDQLGADLQAVWENLQQKIDRR